MLPLEPGDEIDVGNAGGTHPNGDETASNDGWAAFSGTSAAAPQLAGAAALVKQACPSADAGGQIKDILRKTARDVTTRHLQSATPVQRQPSDPTLATGDWPRRCAQGGDARQGAVPRADHSRFSRSRSTPVAADPTDPTDPADPADQPIQPDQRRSPVEPIQPIQPIQPIRQSAGPVVPPSADQSDRADRASGDRVGETARRRSNRRAEPRPDQRTTSLRSSG